MCRWISVAILVFSAVVLSILESQAADEQPLAGDVWATNWFGVSKSAPIYSGWLIVKGKYIDAPYIVEQRGFGIFVNDVMVEQAVQPKLVFSPKQGPFPAADIDPGSPMDLSKTNTGRQAMVNGVSSMKKRYLRRVYTNDEEYVEHLKKYYESLPCVASATIEGKGPSAEIVIIDYYGKKSYLGTACSFEAPLPYTREDMQKSCGRQKMRLETNLKRGFMMTSYGPGIFHEEGGPGADERWRAIFATLESAIPPEDKFNHLKALGYFGGHETAGWAIPLFRDFLANFQGSAQMHQRLNGDNSWIEAARQRLGAATTSAAPASATTAQPAANLPDTTTASNRSPATASPPAASPSRGPVLALGAALLVVLLAAGAYWLRRR